MTVTVPAAPPLATVPGVELVRTGQWNLASGLVTFTADDLASAVAAVGCPSVRRPALKLGHTDPRFDGEPAVGYIDHMTLTAGGHTIVGDYAGMPGWLGDIIASAYPDRSIEGSFDWRCQLGHTHPFVITAVALLGVEHPGVGTLTSLQDVATLYGVTAAADPTFGGGEPVAVTIHARRDTMPNPRPAKVAAAVTSEDVRRAYYQNAPWDEWICEIQLNPLQLIIVDDESGKYFRQPVAVDGEDQFTFGDKVEVRIRYDDVTAPPAAQPGDGSTPAAASAGLIVFASRAESRPGPRPTPGQDEPSGTPPSPPATAAAPTGPTHTSAATDPPAATAAGTTTAGQEEPMAVDAALLRKALGLPPEATDDDVETALEDAGIIKEDEPAGEGDEVAASGDGAGEGADGDSTGHGTDTAAAASAPAPAAAPTAATLAPGTVAIDETALADLRAKAEQGVAARAQQRLEARNHSLDDAIRAGKFPPARRAHWETYWQQDEDGAKQALASLQPGLVPVSDLGEPGEEPSGDAIDAEFDRMFPPTTNARS